MGSFQQISIGVICLVAAFAFGNYVNNNPPADHPLQPDAAVQNDSANLVNNVQSRIAGTDLEVIPKQPAPIATMRSPLKQRFRVPLANSSITAPESASPIVNSIALPPPSQLRVEKPEVQSNPVATAPRLERPPMTKLNDIPDFSDIVSEFRNTQIELPPLGKMPVHANSRKNQTANVIPFAVRKPTSKALADNDVPSLASSDRQQPSFNADDFAPQLNDRFSNSEPTPASNLAGTQAMQREQGLAKSFGFAQRETSSPGNSLIANSNSSADGDTEKPRLGAASLSQVSPNRNPESAGPNPNDVFNQQPVNVKIASNHVVSRHKLSENPNGIATDLTRRNTLARIQGQTASTDTQSNHGSSVLELDNASLAAQNADSTGNRIRAKIPFGLNEQGKSQLVAIKTRASSQLESNSTKFVDHVIQPGESLQSISMRYFGKPDFYLDIYLANRGKLRNPVDTPDGIAIRIPIY